MASPVLPDLTETGSASSDSSLDLPPQPKIEFEQKELSVSEVARKDDFPLIGKFWETAQGSRQEGKPVLNAGLKIYSKRPVIFHTSMRKKQAYARTLHKDDKGAYFEIGQTLIVPEDYEGWFEIVPSDFRRATCYRSVAEIAKDMPRLFFTRSNLKGIRIEGQGKEQKYMERKIPPGSVLATQGTFKAKWRTKAETGFFKKKTKEYDLQEVTYLTCLDTDGSEIQVPYTCSGKFSAIYEHGQLNHNAVYSIKDILRDLSLPIKIRLLFGKAPVVPCIFTGLLVVREASLVDSIIASTINYSRNVLFEIPAYAPVTAVVASNDEALKDQSSYKDAQRLCKKYANVFSKLIKLSPELDTDQKVLQHVPSDPSLMREADEVFRTLDLITDISLSGEPADHTSLDSSEAGSIGSAEQTAMPHMGTFSSGEREYKSNQSHTHV